MPKRYVPRESEFENERASVLSSFSPEMESKVNTNTRKLIITDMINAQFRSGVTFICGFVPPGLGLKPNKLYALKLNFPGK